MSRYLDEIQPIKVPQGYCVTNLVPRTETISLVVRDDSTTKVKFTPGSHTGCKRCQYYRVCGVPLNDDKYVDTCPPVLEYISVSRTTMLTFSVRANM